MSLEVLHKANQLIRDNEINWGNCRDAKNLASARIHTWPLDA